MLALQNFGPETKLNERESSSDLVLLELLLGAGVEDVGGVWVGCGELSCLQPVFKSRVVIQELAPETPGLLDPEINKIY